MAIVALVSDVSPGPLVIFKPLTMDSKDDKIMVNKFSRLTKLFFLVFLSSNKITGISNKDVE